MSKALSDKEIKRFKYTIYNHYKNNGRTLPWRGDFKTPYHIFVSEIMLQQTQVDRVINKFLSFIQAFPDWEHLAGAPLAEVLKHWQGLGYNRRAKMLWESADIIVKKWNGKTPDTTEALISLPGIGKSTAASIQAFAFNKPVIFIETNIRSVFIHHFYPEQSAIDDSRLLPLIEQTLDKEKAFTWYSALMDYGTWLKKQTPNPSRKSRHHTRQSKFQGSTRQIRGAILKLLLNSKGLSGLALAKKINDPQKRVSTVLKILVNEKLITKSGRIYRAGNT